MADADAQPGELAATNARAPSWATDNENIRRIARNQRDESRGQRRLAHQMSALAGEMWHRPAREADHMPGTGSHDDVEH